MSALNLSLLLGKVTSPPHRLWELRDDSNLVAAVVWLELVDAGEGVSATHHDGSTETTGENRIVEHWFVHPMMGSPNGTLNSQELDLTQSTDNPTTFSAAVSKALGLLNSASAHLYRQRLSDLRKGSNALVGRSRVFQVDGGMSGIYPAGFVGGSDPLGAVFVFGDANERTTEWWALPKATGLKDEKYRYGQSVEVDPAPADFSTFIDAANGEFCDPACLTAANLWAFRVDRSARSTVTDT